MGLIDLGFLNAIPEQVIGFIDRIEVVITDIPAPGMAAIFGLGGLFLGLYARRMSCDRISFDRHSSDFCSA